VSVTINPEGVLTGKVIEVARQISGTSRIVLSLKVTGTKTMTATGSGPKPTNVDKRGIWTCFVPEDMAAEAKSLTVGQSVEILSTTTSINAITEAGVTYKMMVEEVALLETLALA
jgi:hypothetical protein